MGFAKYQEDIVSRYVGDLAMRSIKVPVSPIPLHTSLSSIPAMWKKATIRLKIRQIEQFLRTFGMCRSFLAAACPHRIFS